MRYWSSSFGCRVNQYEGQRLREQALGGGAVLVGRFEDADVCVVNTCTVTREADREALSLLRRIVRRNPAARLIVTGCLATRDPGLVAREAPSALIVGNGAKDSLPALFGCQAAPAWSGVEGFQGHSRAFVKIQDGCNMSCSFCIIPSVRPRLSCKPLADLLAEVRGLVASGYREIVLCGVRLGRYLGDDAGRRVDFCVMLERLIDLPGDFRLRLSSLEITDVTERLVALMQSAGARLCPSLHAPLQSGCDAVLKNMGRWYRAEFYRRRAEAFLSRVPRAALFADIMAGFPEESEAEAEESRRFVASLGFSGLHVFRYSSRPRTAAARRPQVPEPAVLRRARELRALDAELRAAFARRAVGQRRWGMVELDGLTALTEDFLSVRLCERAEAGLRPLAVERADGQQAYGRVGS